MMVEVSGSVASSWKEDLEALLNTFFGPEVDMVYDEEVVVTIERHFLWMWYMICSRNV